jgi:hypothetical protein
LSATAFQLSAGMRNGGSLIAAAEIAALLIAVMIALT